jgi:hypothetical protein
LAKNVLLFESSYFFPSKFCTIRFFFCHYQDEEDVKAIARLFADMGDSYVDLIATGNTSWMIMIKILPFKRCACMDLSLDVVYEQRPS